MHARSIASGVAIAVIAGGFGYAWWYDAHPTVVRHGAAIGSAGASAPPGDGTAPTGDGTTPPFGGAAGRAQVPVDAPRGVRARVAIGPTWLDITVLGDLDAARQVCSALVENQLARKVGMPPRLIRGCEPAGLPVVTHEPGFVLQRHRELDALDLTIEANDKQIPGGTVSIDSLALFSTAERCEQARKLLEQHAASANDQAQTAAGSALAELRDLAKRERERACATPGPACTEANEKIEIIERTAGKQHAPVAPEPVPPCRQE